MKVSIIIPVFNEEKVISDCLNSLKEQTYKDIEIIVVDDGSKDQTKEIVKSFSVRLLEQKHYGPGLARNCGAKEAKGEILVFVDADMTFDRRFIELLTRPIRGGRAIGTFSKYEYVNNKNNIWSKCWNINKGLPLNKMHKENYPDTQPVFRAILRREFLKVGGFEPIGYIDDHTLAKKLSVLAISAPGAIFYHRNPENLLEVYKQARWIGKSEYKNRKVKNEFLMRIIAIIRFSLVFSLLVGVFKSVRFTLPQFLIFKFVYDLGIEISLVKSFMGEQVNK
ncbi:MAG: glycosyltransferase family 2 protein [Candidatus Daviesbacteria bacterium]|nr:glycosyltransferase family 2 protein [Candidatus Daviesbacteria bacterium]